MRAIRAAHAFDGTQFLSGGATVVLDGDRIAGVHTGWLDLPGDIDVTDYDGTVLPGLFDCHTHAIVSGAGGTTARPWVAANCARW
jgi:imidazolonepropionase-like amidohydrolase